LTLSVEKRGLILVIRPLFSISLDFF